MPTLQYCDRDEYLRLLKEEADAAEPKPADPVGEEAVDDVNVAAEIEALRLELKAAITLLRTDIESCFAAAESALSGGGVGHIE